MPRRRPHPERAQPSPTASQLVRVRRQPHEPRPRRRVCRRRPLPSLRPRPTRPAALLRPRHRRPATRRATAAAARQRRSRSRRRRLLLGAGGGLLTARRPSRRGEGGPRGLVALLLVLARPQVRRLVRVRPARVTAARHRRATRFSHPVLIPHDRCLSTASDPEEQNEAPTRKRLRCGEWQRRLRSERHAPEAGVALDAGPAVAVLNQVVAAQDQPAAPAPGETTERAPSGPAALGPFRRRQRGPAMRRARAHIMRSSSNGLGESQRHQLPVALTSCARAAAARGSRTAAAPPCRRARRSRGSSGSAQTPPAVLTHATHTGAHGSRRCASTQRRPMDRSPLAPPRPPRHAAAAARALGTQALGCTVAPLTPPFRLTCARYRCAHEGRLPATGGGATMGTAPTPPLLPLGAGGCGNSGAAAPA